MRIPCRCTTKPAEIREPLQPPNRIAYKRRIEEEEEEEFEVSLEYFEDPNGEDDKETISQQIMQRLRYLLDLKVSSLLSRI